MRNYRNHSTVRHGRDAITRTSYLHLNASPIRVRSQSWTRSRTHNTAHLCLRRTCSSTTSNTFQKTIQPEKADWTGYATELDKLILDVEPTPANYNRFVVSVRNASRRYITRGCRTEFIPGLTEESKSLYEAYKTQYSNSPFDVVTIESGNALLDSMIKEKKRRWEEVITSTNMTHNSRQTWKTIRMLSNDPTSSSPPCLVNANQVAHQLLVNGRGNMPSKPKRPVIP